MSSSLWARNDMTFAGHYMYLISQVLILNDPNHHSEDA